MSGCDPEFRMLSRCVAKLTFLKTLLVSSILSCLLKFLSPGVYPSCVVSTSPKEAWLLSLSVKKGLKFPLTKKPMG